ncbi:hemerythrin domain-containing protein [Streptomonospora nanhaiensis]|uniref:Hemerythrin-like domain-containing protein n=1 Tax=Streptomonospora nanhaiensis TaxID=1323731 RepID=A0A853BP35_9ACTN|nr:hemerythrin domain-containing protein [Streptomonospora nanhaiensis]MBV2363409.1 hemerythrin domain-containing protein [Streptomonospora nanhaiensis]MBX9389656.1 hemerythrin domain-containing protein [Streptomonospora nanhaiensis]NYI96933.1 hemerythrin-like domain-containing protein [Streptomonospora nanhaiensis]
MADRPADGTAQRLVAWGDELVRLHDGFRRDLAALREDADRLRRGLAPRGRGAPPLAEQLRGHCLAFCDRLHEHHGEEDTALFPALGADFPELTAALERLRREHAVVARLLARIRAAVAELEDGPDHDGPDGGRTARLADDLDRLSAELTAHLDYEEAQLVPVLNRLTTLPGH